MCRPRFFSGQLLTEEDLNRLDRYIIGKNRLHNRMLFGWGVVNGLEVTCSSCSDQVHVSAGYALSPCGDDIVVCKDTSVDICKLANDCCNDKRTDDCGPYAPRPDPDCEDLEQKWILAICYDETPSRGVTPLRDTAAACCSRCSCGGSSNCGCGCHGKSGQTQKSSRPTSARRPAPQCEPTVICEGYRFTLFRPAPAKISDGNTLGTHPVRGLTNPFANVQSPGELGLRFIDCVSDLLVVLSSIEPPPRGDVNRLYEWCCSLKGAFQDYLEEHGGVACSIYDMLNSFHCPDPRRYENNPEGYLAALQAELGKLTGHMQQTIYACLCSALLPPVPPPAMDNCVPLAEVTLRRRDCTVVDICNISARKFATTFTNLSYWLSPLERIIEQLRQRLDLLCCSRRVEEREVPVEFSAASRTEYVGRGAFYQSTREAPAAAGERFRYAWAKHKTSFDPRGLILDTLGLVQPGGEPYLTPLERSDPLQTLLLDQLVVPFLANLSRPDEQKFASTAQPDADVSEAAAPAAQPEAPAPQPTIDDLDQLRKRLDELASLVAQQEAEIARLRTERGSKPKRGKGQEGKQ
jgi:hypothetical protein